MRLCTAFSSMYYIKLCNPYLPFIRFFLSRSIFLPPPSLSLFSFSRFFSFASVAAGSSGASRKRKLSSSGSGGGGEGGGSEGGGGGGGEGERRWVIDERDRGDGGSVSYSKRYIHTQNLNIHL